MSDKSHFRRFGAQIKYYVSEIYGPDLYDQHATFPEFDLARISLELGCSLLEEGPLSMQVIERKGKRVRSSQTEWYSW